MEKGKVYLVGAGPGDPGLLTVKGLWCIRHADVIIYDYLASNALLNEAKENAELIYAGKRSGYHHMSQEEIQELLLEKAMEGKSVLRLKGGDPFIFGRGGEEALALAAAEVAFEIVPGVSSAYSVPACAGIPVTHRGMASQVHFITGHEQRGGSSVDYRELAKSEGTLVFLMGVQRIKEIAEMLMKYGKDGKTPAAVIRNGTMGVQEEVISRLDTIGADVQKSGIKPPGIFVVGDVVSLSETIHWRSFGRLSRKRILLTGTRELVRKQHRSLLHQGADPVDMSLIYTEPASDEILQHGVSLVPMSAWTVFTSSHGVTLFFRSLKRFGRDLRSISHLKFAVVGSGTGETLKSYGFLPDYMPETYTSQALAEGLAEKLTAGERVLVFRAKEGSSLLNQCFCEKGISYEDIPAYTTRVDWRKKDMLIRALTGADYMTFASASAVRAFVEMAGVRENYPAVVCIGPVTAEAAVKAGLKVAAVAEDYTIEGLTKCLCQQEIKE